MSCTPIMCICFRNMDFHQAQTHFPFSVSKKMLSDFDKAIIIIFFHAGLSNSIHISFEFTQLKLQLK